MNTMRLVFAVVFALLTLVGCDRGVEANPDNLTHFASVTSELRRDARELELLAKKVTAVRNKLERRRGEIAEHVYSDEVAKQRELLLAALQVKPSQPSADGTTPSTSEPSNDALVGAATLHQHLFTPLRVFDDSLARDPDYGWWIDELGLTSADASLVSDADTRDDRARTAEDCRTLYDIKSRAEACRQLLDIHTTPAYFAQVKQQWLADLDTEAARLSMIETEFSNEAVERRASAAKVMDAYGSSFDGLIIWGFPALVIAVLIIVLFEGRRRKLSPDGAQQLDTLAVITVLLLVSAIIILGLGGKIQPEALGTLIGGISGYVLGKSAQTLFGGDNKSQSPVAAAPVAAAPVAAAPAAVGEPQQTPPAIEPTPEPMPVPSESVPGDKPQILAAAPANGDASASKN